MRLTNIFDRKPTELPLPIFDETFLRRLERLSFRTVASLRGAMFGERRSRNLRPALDFSDHRPYTTGDDLRHVDWNAYARHEELFVKLGEATQSVNVHILFDSSRSMSWTSSAYPGSTSQASPHLGAVSKWDGARRLAGALGYLALAGGERLTITPYAHTLAGSFGPTQGKRQGVRALQFVSTIEPVPPLGRGAVEGDLARSLLTYARTHPGGGLLVLISDLLDTVVSLPHIKEESEGVHEEDQLAEGLRHFAPPRWQVLVMHLLTEQEVHPTFEGDYDLRDLETEESLPFHFDDYTLAQYRLRVRHWCAGLQSTCARRGATYSRILAEWPFEQAVIPYLRQRGVLQ